MHSSTEEYFLKRSSLPYLDKKYEKIPVLTVDNYRALGQLTALRFIEWIINNPEGVVSLPTGKVSQHFIKWLHYYIDNWKNETGNGILPEVGITAKKPPSFKELHLVQTGEFFPISPENERSCHYYIRKYYIKDFGFDIDKAIMIDTCDTPVFEDPVKHSYSGIEDIFPNGRIDLNLRHKLPVDKLSEAQKIVIKHFDQICETHEEKIRVLGGIGFFLDTIGPDGHIAFNGKGSSHLSYTRLTYMNYETMAAAAADLGGIEIVRKKAVITIGLETISYNLECTAVIFVAGEENAELIAQAVENPPQLSCPASSLQKLPNARFYLTKGAASRLKERRFQTLLQSKKIPERKIDKLIIDGAFLSGVKLKELTDSSQQAPSKNNPYWNVAEQLMKKSVGELADKTIRNLKDKIKKGLNIPENQRFLHTGPHHDDIELAYFPLLHHLVRSPTNKNYFGYMTSGYTSVTNDFVQEGLMTLLNTIKNGDLFKAASKDDLCNPELREIEIHGYLNAIAQQNKDSAGIYSAMRFFRHFAEYLDTDSDYRIVEFSEEQIDCIQKHIPGSQLPEAVKMIKSWIREWESELVWAHFGLNISDIYHLRLKFYSENLFSNDIELECDVMPIVNLLEKIKPTIVTLAMDPEGSGPDTHYKTLLALRSALQTYSGKNGHDKPRIWGYRNVWSQFHPAEATTIVPVSLNSFAVLHNMFNTCFLSQKSASFPSTKFDGTFSELAQKTWVQQFNDLTALLGKGLFYNDDHPMMRRAYGIIYLRDMSCDEFFKETEEIRVD